VVTSVTVMLSGIELAIGVIEGRTEVLLASVTLVFSNDVTRTTVVTVERLE